MKKLFETSYRFIRALNEAYAVQTHRRVPAPLQYAQVKDNYLNVTDGHFLLSLRMLEPAQHNCFLTQTALYTLSMPWSKRADLDYPVTVWEEAGGFYATALGQRRDLTPHCVVLGESTPSGPFPDRATARGNPNKTIDCGIGTLNADYLTLIGDLARTLLWPTNRKPKDLSPYCVTLHRVWSDNQEPTSHVQAPRLAPFLVQFAQRQDVALTIMPAR